MSQIIVCMFEGDDSKTRYFKSIEVACKLLCVNIEDIDFMRNTFEVVEFKNKQAVSNLFSIKDNDYTFTVGESKFTLTRVMLSTDKEIKYLMDAIGPDSDITNQVTDTFEFYKTMTDYMTGCSELADFASEDSIDIEVKQYLNSRTIIFKYLDEGRDTNLYRFELHSNLKIEE